MAEGRVRNASGTLTSEYMVKYQQGNVRVSFEDNSGTAVVRQENSFYPYGLTMLGSALPSADNKRLYNGGSEWRNDFADLPDLQQTFYRNGAYPEEGWNPALGRFVGVDPLPESAGGMTVYQYAMDNPVMMNDPMGDQYQQSGAGFWLPSHRIGPGSGNHWSDGMNYSDWNPWTGSDMYREGLAAGFTDIGGYLYHIDSNGSRDKVTTNGNGSLGYWTSFGQSYQTGDKFFSYEQAEHNLNTIGIGRKWNSIQSRFRLENYLSFTVTASSRSMNLYNVDNGFAYLDLSQNLTKDFGDKKSVDVNVTIIDRTIKNNKFFKRSIRNKYFIL